VDARDSLSIGEITSWEDNMATDFGLKLGLFDNRLSLETGMSVSRFGTMPGARLGGSDFAAFTIAADSTARRSIASGHP